MSEQPATGSISDGLTAYLDRKVERFKESIEEALATGEADAIHRLRVASRRINEPLSLLRERISPRDLKSVKRGLKRLRGAFRKVRDLDVLLNSVSAAASGDSAGSNLADLEDRLSERRTEAFERASQRSRKLKPRRTIEALCAIRQELDGADSDDAHLGRRMEERLRELAAALIKCDPRSAGGDLHPARLHAKRLRYAAELAHQAGNYPTDALVEALAGMQTLLGQWNDHVTAARWLARFGRRRSVLSRDAAWSASLLEQAAERARAAEAERGKVLHEWAALEAHLQAWHRNPVDQEPAPPSTNSPSADTPDTRSSGPSGEYASEGFKIDVIVEPLKRERIEGDVEHV